MELWTKYPSDLV